MKAPKGVLTESSLDDQLRSWRWLVLELPGWLKEGRDDLQTDNSEAVVAAYQWAFRETKQGERQLQRYEDELEKILAILSKDKMRRYCELKARALREGETGDVSMGLSKLRLGFERPEREAQPKINQLLEVIHECGTAVSLYRNHLKWVETVAWKQEILVPEEDQEASPVAPDQQRNPRRAGRKPDENVRKRRKTIFKRLDIKDLEEAKRHWQNPTVRHEIYQLLDKEGIKMITSKKFRSYTKWTELSEDPVDDMDARDTLFKDLKRNWNQLLEEHKT